MSQRLCQIAFSVSDLRRSHQWYQDLFGFVPSGGTEAFKGWAAEKVQGVPGAASTCQSSSMSTSRCCRGRTGSNSSRCRRAGG